MLQALCYREFKIKQISYGSRVLKYSGKNHWVTRKEILAVMYFVQNFKQIIPRLKLLLRTNLVP